MENHNIPFIYPKIITYLFDRVDIRVWCWAAFIIIIIDVFITEFFRHLVCTQHLKISVKVLNIM